MDQVTQVPDDFDSIGPTLYGPAVPSYDPYLTNDTIGVTKVQAPL